MRNIAALKGREVLYKIISKKRLHIYKPEQFSDFLLNKRFNGMVLSPLISL